MKHTARKVSGRAAARQSVGRRCDRTRASRSAPGRQRLAFRAALGAGLLGAGLLLSACGPGGSADAPPAERDAAAVGDAPTGRIAAAARPAGPAVTLGVDVLLRDSLGLLEGRRVGLITNHTGLSWPTPAYGAPPPVAERDAVSTIDRLAAHPALELVALFSPEHGIRGDVDRPVDSSVDAVTGLPIHSLYGDTRKPTPAMLEGVDALVFDIQDIGTRYYSYVWTMALAMEAAAEHGLRFVVLDRPNPIGGTLVQGNVRPSYMPVAYYEAAMRHGLTAGELARYVNAEYDLGVDLHVVPMEGWARSMWWEDTGIPWMAPSPNMPSVESATHYPGTCLFEGTNLSVGRGTPEAFRQWGATWLDADAVAAALRARHFPGVRFEVVTFTPEGPTDGKYGSDTVRGIRQTVTDRSVYDPVPVTIAALLEVTRLHGDVFRWRDGWFDGLAGGPRLRERIQAGAALDQITAGWPEQRAVFRATVEPYLLYD